MTQVLYCMCAHLQMQHHHQTINSLAGLHTSSLTHWWGTVLGGALGPKLLVLLQGFQASQTG